MTDEDIRKLAEQYAELTDGSPADKAYIRAIAQCFTEWLSKKFCIVEKEKVRALYSKMELYGNHVDSDNDLAVYEAMDELENLFGKELFNDTEK